jgi:hypothetical protein
MKPSCRRNLRRTAARADRSIPAMWAAAQTREWSKACRLTTQAASWIAEHRCTPAKSSRKHQLCSAAHRTAACDGLLYPTFVFLIARLQRANTLRRGVR